MPDGPTPSSTPRGGWPRPRILLTALILALAAASFMLGITLPIVKLNRLFFFSDEHSILSMIGGLISQGEILLGLIMLLFSIALPALKITLLSGLLVCGRRPRPPLVQNLVGALGKWSMVDVLVVALVIFAVRSSGLGTALSQPGLYFFAASVAMTMAASAMVPRASE